MKTYNYVVMFHGAEVGRGTISLIRGAGIERMSSKILQLYGPKRLGFTFSII